MRNIFYIIFFIGVALHGQTKMNSAESATLKAKVKTKATTINTLLSDFTQYKHLDFLSKDIITSGKLAFKSPNMIKWEYITPFKYVVIFKNEKLFINDEGKKSNIDIGSNKMFKHLNTLIINSVKGDMFDENEFDITYYKEGVNSKVYFSPKDESFSKYIKAFHITFNVEGDVVELKMVEQSEDYTRIVFNNRKINTALSDAIFNQ
ncbi:outer membrane lipoprotein carrier protein LolA [Flavivirga aquimarina]|uniref:Outer membrane lipoprotein carrier protein LolA n=1 Tax=Flavivirga aquimarina TaxID=2027862 RepID=A0ABT8WF03_9FLAO|nr:outer membrane lipoprotein carrier protein LolA [Flavivirga aquimarina]MDO5971747.1 outer membrane lipoprotein carrier protein LolA [Flavivirga aquimarina]